MNLGMIIALGAVAAAACLGVAIARRVDGRRQERARRARRGYHRGLP